MEPALGTVWHSCLAIHDTDARWISLRFACWTMAIDLVSGYLGTSGLQHYRCNAGRCSGQQSNWNLNWELIKIERISYHFFSFVSRNPVWYSNILVKVIQVRRNARACRLTVWGLQVAVQSNDKKRFETKVEADKDWTKYGRDFEW